MELSHSMDRSILNSVATPVKISKALADEARLRISEAISATDHMHRESALRCVVSLAYLLLRFRPENHIQLAVLNFKTVSFSGLGQNVWREEISPIAQNQRSGRGYFLPGIP
jgi:hypothetical protein